MAKKKTRLVVTGGAGFIGTNYVYHVVEAHPDYQVVVVDKLTYAGNRANLEPLDERIEFICADICDVDRMCETLVDVDYLVHFAAESHNTRSETNPDLFYRTNVEGTRTLLEAAIKAEVKKVVHISTDEVYGEVPEGIFCKETDKEPGDHQATSAYSKSKAQADDLAASYCDRLVLNIVRPTNNFGPWQYPEKVLPRSITRVLSGKPIPLWGEGNQVRDWLFARDTARAIDLVLHKASPGEIYNVAANNRPEIRNRDWAHWLHGRLYQLGAAIEFQVDPRPHHDFRYGIDAAKLREELGWRPSPDVWRNFEITVQWYFDHREWWSPLIAEAESIYDRTR